MPCCVAQTMADSMRDIFEDIFENRAARSDASRRGAPCGRNLRARFYKSADGRRRRRGLCRCCSTAGRCARRRGGAGRAGARTGAGAGRRMGRAAGQDRSRASCRSRGSPTRSSTALRPRRSRSRRRSRTISAPTCLFYRAPSRPAWSRSQRAHWDPVVDWAREALGARFVLVEGVMHRAAARRGDRGGRAAIPTAPMNEAWRLGALNVATTLTGSALLALRSPPAGSRPTRPGRRRMSTRTGTCSSGAATSWRCSAAPTASPRCRRRRTCSRCCARECSWLIEALESGALPLSLKRRGEESLPCILIQIEP